jgi:hypothetical protein
MDDSLVNCSNAFVIFLNYKMKAQGVCDVLHTRVAAAGVRLQAFAARWIVVHCMVPFANFCGSLVLKSMR